MKTNLHFPGLRWGFYSTRIYPGEAGRARSLCLNGAVIQFHEAAHIII